MAKNLADMTHEETQALMQKLGRKVQDASPEDAAFVTLLFDPNGVGYVASNCDRPNLPGLLRVFADMLDASNVEKN